MHFKTRITPTAITPLSKPLFTEFTYFLVNVYHYNLLNGLVFEDLTGCGSFAATTNEDLSGMGRNERVRGGRGMKERERQIKRERKTNRVK